MGANVLKRIWDMAEEEVRKKHLVLVCNTKHSAASHTDSGRFSMDTEYYSDDEFEQVLSMFYHIGLPLDVFSAKWHRTGAQIANTGVLRSS